MGTRRKFSPDDRLSIVREAEREGRLETIRKYALAPSLFDRWRQKYLTGGVDGLKNAHRRIDPQIRALEEENARLKRIIARQSLEMEVKYELLKKAHTNQDKKMIIDQFKDKATISELCSWVSFAPSNYYYKSRTGKPGARPSTHTWRTDGIRVLNTEVLNEIRSTLEAEFCCYGYRNVTSVLRDKAYLINHKRSIELWMRINCCWASSSAVMGSDASCSIEESTHQDQWSTCAWTSSTCGLRAKNATITY